MGASDITFGKDDMLRFGEQDEFFKINSIPAFLFSSAVGFWHAPHEKLISIRRS